MLCNHTNHANIANTRPLCVMCHVQVYFYTSVHSYNFKAEGDF